MKAGTWFILFNDDTITLEAAAQGLKGAGNWQVEIKSQALDRGMTQRQILVREGPHQFFILLDNTPHVLAESKEIAAGDGSKRADRATIAQCARRFEIAYELRVDMENFNTLLLIEHALQKVLGQAGITYDPMARMFP